MENRLNKSCSEYQHPHIALQSLVENIKTSGMIKVFPYGVFSNGSETQFYFHCNPDLAGFLDRLLKIATYDDQLESGWCLCALYDVSNAPLYLLRSNLPLGLSRYIPGKKTARAPIIRDIDRLKKLFFTAIQIKAGEQPLPDIHPLCLSTEQEAWRSIPPDPGICELVKTLNESGVIRTIASCEGHFTRNRIPYVAFFSTDEVVRAVWQIINSLHDKHALYYRWTVSGSFDWKSRLVFSIRPTNLDHSNGIFVDFYNFVVLRKRIDKDLQLLAETIKDCLKQPGGVLENIRILPAKEQQSSPQNDQPHHKIGPALLQPLTPNITNWVRICKLWTSCHRIRCNLIRTCLTALQRNCHLQFLSLQKYRLQFAIHANSKQNFAQPEVVGKSPLDRIDISYDHDLKAAPASTSRPEVKA